MRPAGDDRCPVCRAALWAPDDEPIGRKKCPRCGAELWVLTPPGGPLFFLRQPGESEYGFLAALAAPLFGVSAEQMEETLKGADSLDLVEIIMDVEDAIRPGGTARPSAP